MNVGHCCCLRAPEALSGLARTKCTASSRTKDGIFHEFRTECRCRLEGATSSPACAGCGGDRPFDGHCASPGDARSECSRGVALSAARIAGWASLGWLCVLLAASASCHTGSGPRAVLEYRGARAPADVADLRPCVAHRRTCRERTWGPCARASAPILSELFLVSQVRMQCGLSAGAGVAGADSGTGRARFPDSRQTWDLRAAVEVECVKSGWCVE